MGLCTDNALTYLNGIGYNVVRVPRKGINPLDILGRDGKSLERLGRIDKIWTSTEKLPDENPAQPAAQISGTKTNEMNASVGVKLLGGILGSLGATVPSLDFAFGNAKSLQFTFGDVTIRNVDAFAVGSYLAHGDLIGDGPIFERYFDDDDTETYIITDVLEAKSITVAGKNSQKETVKADIPVIQQAVGGNLAIAPSSDSTGGVTFTGEAPVVFGFKAFNIGFDGKWRMSGASPSAEMAFDKPGGEMGISGESQPVLIANPGALRL